MTSGVGNSPWRRAVTWPVEHPLATILITFIVALTCALGASRLRPEPSMESMFDASDPAARSLMKVVREFGAAEEMLLLVSLPDEGPADAARLLAYAQRLEQALAASPLTAPLVDGVAYRVDPDMMRFFQEQLVPAGLYYLDDAAMAAARQRLSREGIEEQIAHNEALVSAPGPAAAAIARITLRDPLRLHEFLLERLAASRPFQTHQNAEDFLTPDGRGLLIRIRGNEPPSDIEYAKRFSAAVAEVANEVNLDALRLDFAGSYPIAAASERAIRADMVASVTFAVICLQLLFILVYRRPVRLFILAFFPVFMGVLVGFGLQSLVSDSITPLTGVIGGILAGLAIDYSIHLISDYETHRRGGMLEREAASATAIAIAPALLAAWLTSAIGFVAIGWSSVPAIRGFALLGTLGLTGAFLTAMFVLPALIALADRRTLEQVARRSQLRFGMSGLLHQVNRFRRPLVVISCIALVGSGVILARSEEGVLPLETDLTAMHPRPNPPLDAQAAIADRFGASPDAMIVHLEAYSPERLLALSHDARARLADRAVREAGGIASTFGLADLLPDPRIVARRADSLSAEQAQRIVADFRAVIDDSSFDPAAYNDYATFLETLLTNTSPPALDALLRYRSLALQLLPSDDVDAQRPPTQGLMLVFARTSLDTRESRAATIESVRAALADLPGATITGINVLGHDAEHVIHRDLPRFILIASIAVAIYLGFHFKRLGALVLSLLPMIASILVLLAIARLADVRLNMVNLVAAPLLIGIDVDYGIFLVSLAAAGRRLSLDQLIERISATCHGIVVCACSTVLGFGSLYFTSVPAIASLGFVTAVGVIACVVLIFTLVLPLAFILRRDPR